MNAEATAVGCIIRLVLRAALRQRVLGGVLAGVVALAVIALGLRSLHFGGGEERLVVHLGVAALAIGGIAVTLALTVEVLGGVNGRNSAAALWPKAVSRPAYVIGHGLGVWSVSGLLCALMLGMLGAFAAVADREGRSVEWAALASVVWLQWLKFGLVGAVGLLMTAIARSGVLAILLSLMVLAAGQLRGEVTLLSFGDRPVTALLNRVLNVLVPDLSLFDRSDSLDGVALLPLADVGWLTAYALVYGAVFASLTIHVYRHREA